MSNTATFTLHIRNIVKMARDKIGWVLRVFQSRKHSLMLTLLKSLFIPVLEYCCQLWNPWKAKDIQAIEAIQRTFTYKINEVQHLNSLPKSLRDIESVKTEKLKFELDKFLELIPDEPKTPNYVTASGSNSILAQLTHLRAQEMYQSGGVSNSATEQY